MPEDLTLPPISGQLAEAPQGMPYLVSPEPAADMSWMGHIFGVLAARDTGDRQAFHEAIQWARGNRDGAAALLCGLWWLASVTVSVRGPQARQAVVDLAQAWRGLGWLGQVRPGIADGYVEAPGLVLDYLEGRHPDAHRLIDQWSVDVDRIVGAASALADMLIGTSREMFGRADEWLAALHFSLTGQGRPPGPVPVSDPVENLERELHHWG